MNNTYSFYILSVLSCGFFHLVLELSSGDSCIPITEATTEARADDLERKLDEVVRLLKGQHCTRLRGRSPPQRECWRVETEDRWDGASRRERGTRYSPPFHGECRDSWSHDQEEEHFSHS